MGGGLTAALWAPPRPRPPPARPGPARPSGSLGGRDRTMASAEPAQSCGPEAGGERGGERERPGDLEERSVAAAGDAEPAEVSGAAGAAAALLGETGLAVGCCIAAALSWERPLHSLGGFACANLLFW